MLQNSGNVLQKLHSTFHQHDGEQMMTKYIKCVCCLSCLIVTGFLHRYAFLTLSHYYIMSVAQIKYVQVLDV